MERFIAGRNYLKYRLRAKTPHGIHSPFVFDLLNNVIRDERKFYGFDLIESLRARHLLDDREINVIDYGTGQAHRKEKISVIARKSVKPKKYAQLLFRLVNRFQPQNILEIGTSLGFTTLYMSYPSKKNRIITLEGCPEISTLANKNFNKLKRENIELICGEFNISLPKALSEFQTVDFVYFDGNHRKEPTLSYFESCLAKADENSVFVFDDIHWSKEMNEAWEIIKENNTVTITIDLYQLGLVFFKKGVVKQHFTLKF